MTMNEAELEYHRNIIQECCRVCSESVKTDTRKGKVVDFQSEFKALWDIHVLDENNDVYPPSICYKCKRALCRYRDEGCKTEKMPIQWEPHIIQDCILCGNRAKGSEEDSGIPRRVGRPRKRKGKGKGKGKCKVGKGDEKSKPGGDTTVLDLESDCDTDSADESQYYCSNTYTDEIFVEARNKCLALPVEKALQVARDIAEMHGFLIIELDNVRNSLSSADNNLIAAIVKEAIAINKDKVKADAAFISQSKSLEEMIESDPKKWMEERTEVVQGVVDSLSDRNTPTIAKVVAAEHLYALTNRRFLSPFSFAKNVVSYSLTRSKLLADLNGKMHPGGSYTTIKSWLGTLSLDLKPFPDGDVLVAFDNDQIIQKRWTVRVENKAKVSILTSICYTEVEPEGRMQRKAELSPRNWEQRLKEARNDEEEMETLVDECSTPQQMKIIRQENKEMIHGYLKELVKQHKKAANGSWTDEIDERVESIEAHIGKRVCPVCSTLMDRKKRKCVNQECRVDLKQAEERLNGTDVLGTALIQPVREYNYQFRETTVGFTVQGDGEISRTKAAECLTNNEREGIPSSHRSEPIPVKVSDPVFVNPSSYSSIKQVLRVIGKAATIRRYAPKVDNPREWLPITMDGLPYSLAQYIIENTLICIECELINDGECEDRTIWKKDWEDHKRKVHHGRNVKSVKEFDWVILRIGKLHVEMNMGKYLLEFGWDVFMSSLATELGFTSEAAQKYAKQGSNTHHTITLLKVAHRGTWMELLLPYVQDRLDKGMELSVNDFLYEWKPAVKDPNYNFMFRFVWMYLGGFFTFHYGVRRNNHSYVQAGMESFAELFHYKTSSKYGMIELQDRCAWLMYPLEVSTFLEKYESISSSGNPSKGEDMDAQLEEINKLSKLWHKGATMAIDWLRIFRNLENLSKMRTWLFASTGLKDPKDDAVIARRKYNLEAEILAWRIKLRRACYFMKPYEERDHVSVEGDTLDHKLVDCEGKLKENRKKCLREIVVSGKSKSEVQLCNVYVTLEDQNKAEDISNATKAEIIARIEPKLSAVCDVETRERLELKCSALKQDQQKVKKEQFVELYEEICEELTLQEEQEAEAFIIEDEDE